MVAERLRFVTFPREDATFASCVQEVATRLIDGAGISDEVLSEMLAELRPEFPAVEIRQQDLLASFDSVPVTWYVHRDGVITP